MNSYVTGTSDVQVSVENVGGIDSTTVSFSPGITILSGRNATNRTSFLRSVMGALGSDDVSLKGDAEQGEIELTIGDETYTRYLERTGDGLTTAGDPYLEDPEVADLFAFHLQTNEARRAVEGGDDLRELIMRPIDTAAIQEEIERLQSEKRAIDAELEELDELSRRLPSLEEERTTLTESIEEKRQELEAKRTELDEADENVAEGRDGQSELEDALATLQSTQSELEDARFDLETERETLSHVIDEQDELEAELESLSETETETIETVEERITTLREQKQALDSEINDLQTIVRFNEDMLDGASADVLSALRDDESESVTDQLLEDEQTVICWTCGSEVKREEIEDTLDRLRDLRKEKVSERSTIQSDLRELTSTQKELQSRQDRRQRITRRLDEIDDEIERRKARIDDLEERREDLTAEIETLETDVERLESEEYGEIVDLHKEVNTLEIELRNLEGEREDVEAEIDRIETRIDDRDRLERQRDEVREALEEQRTRIERIEREAVDHFNEHMETILELLDYDNLERIWIERTDGPELGSDRYEGGRFDLHIVRTADSGRAYEDTIEHLSESEREVTGIVFALAGYLAHEVYEDVPFILLDSLEAIDADRIARLVEYVAEYAEYLVVALLTEDAAPLEGKYETVTEI
nr:archaea-specific SMC-related protein [Natribaculum luteum]